MIFFKKKSYCTGKFIHISPESTDKSYRKKIIHCFESYLFYLYVYLSFFGSKFPQGSDLDPHYEKNVRIRVLHASSV